MDAEGLKRRARWLWSQPSDHSAGSVHTTALATQLAPTAHPPTWLPSSRNAGHADVDRPHPGRCVCPPTPSLLLASPTSLSWRARSLSMRTRQEIFRARKLQSAKAFRPPASGSREVLRPVLPGFADLGEEESNGNR